MITLSLQNFNSISQSIYDDLLSNLPMHRLTCPCCKHSSCLKIHGYYTRNIKQKDIKLPIRICRVKCQQCNSTHSLLPSSIVPYSQISLPDQQQICLCYNNDCCSSYVCDNNPLIDENNVKSVIRNYRLRWREMLSCLSIDLSPLKELVSMCFSNYSMQFMQNRRIPNTLFPITT